ncbi:MAG: TetR/AcrR family transcriptional regulator [Pirellulales bacterium]
MVFPHPKSSNSAAEERRVKRREAIVQVATNLFAKMGYAECEMEKVAQELGIAKGTLYLYFKGKEELFLACVDNGMAQMQKVVRQAAENAPSPMKRIELGIRAYLTYFDEHPQQAELLIQERAYFRDRKKPTYFEYRDSGRVAWRELYTTLQRDGILRSDLPVERILDTIGNVLYGTMFTNFFIGRTVSLDEQVASTLEILMRGILKDGEQ